MICSFVPLKVDGKQYVIVQDGLDGFPVPNGEMDFRPVTLMVYHLPLEHPVKASRPY